MTKPDDQQQSRPGQATAAAVLGFLLAAATAAAAVIMLAVVHNIGDTVTAPVGTRVTIVGWVLALVQFGGAALLVFGGVRLLRGRGRAAVISGVVLELVLGMLYLTAAVVANGTKGAVEVGAALAKVARGVGGVLPEYPMAVQTLLVVTMVGAALVAVVATVSLSLASVARIGHYLGESPVPRRANPGVPNGSATPVTG